MSGKRRLMYGLVIGAGLMALAADRFLGSGVSNRPAAAQGSETGAPGAAPTTAPAAIKSAIRVEAAAFPRSLPEAVAPSLMRDPFALTEVIREALLGPSASDAGAETSAALLAASARRCKVKEFLARHELSVVVIQGDEALAVVDGRLVTPGQRVEGCRLAEIADNAAYFECDDGLAKLVVQASPSGGGS